MRRLIRLLSLLLIGLGLALAPAAGSMATMPIDMIGHLDVSAKADCDEKHKSHAAEHGVHCCISAASGIALFAAISGADEQPVQASEPIDAFDDIAGANPPYGIFRPPRGI